MEVLIAVALLALVAVLAELFGAEGVLGAGDRQAWWPGLPRRSSTGRGR